MVKIAIVGSSHLTEDEKLKVSCEIETIVRRLKDEDRIITGDAAGVDEQVRLWTPKHKLIVCEAKTKEWNHPNGFKARNLMIAQMADKVISISTKIKDEKCYHCNKEHQRTGGCYTMSVARKLNKPTELIII